MNPLDTSCSRIGTHGSGFSGLPHYIFYINFNVLYMAPILNSTQRRKECPMQIEGRVWCQLSQDARDDYLQWYGKVYVTFGNHVQEISLEHKPEAVLEAVKRQPKRMAQPT
jgi:hypothetical protein